MPPAVPRSLFSCAELDIDELVARPSRSGSGFRHIRRVSVLEPAAVVAAAIQAHETSGEPLIIGDLHKHDKWPTELFSLDWYAQHAKQDISVRNMRDSSDKVIPLSEFIEKSNNLSPRAIPGETERLYGKDAPCPEEWNKWMHDAGVVPVGLLPENTDNLLQNRPQSTQVETLMCYLGVGDTYTPCHKDLCASSGHNLMCFADSGSSFWFMTESSSAGEMAKYFQSIRQELDHEMHAVTVAQLAKAPCPVFVAEQKLGDLVLVPPRSCHQVVNHGGLTVKMSWSRMTLKGLSVALYHELPIYRRVCRPETYRVKSTIHHSLLKWTAELEDLPSTASSSTLVSNLKLALQLFDHILQEEYAPEDQQVICAQASAPSLDITCDFCGADIFHAFFECRTCSPDQKAPIGEGYAVCSGCFADGRSCKCVIMTPTVLRPFSELLGDRQRVVTVLRAHSNDAEILSTEFVYHATVGLSRLTRFRQLYSQSAYSGVFRAACLLNRIRDDKRQASQVSILLIRYPGVEFFSARETVYPQARIQA
ncbi:hypothetical protein C8J56DRAFT_794320 [Mycena floridula]|nr:hypothetical protein C8J56DRAFT_794320 [Mycena floridula]